MAPSTTLEFVIQMRSNAMAVLRTELLVDTTIAKYVHWHCVTYFGIVVCEIPYFGMEYIQ